MPLIALAAWATATGAATNDNVQIALAARAPYQALAGRDAAALCGDFTPAAAASLVSQASPRLGCAGEVARAFADTPDDAESPTAMSPGGWGVNQVTHSGDNATAVLSIGDVGSAAIALRLIGTRWRIATRARLEVFAACVAPPGVTTCPPSSRQLLFTMGTLMTTGSGRVYGPAIPVPAAVQRAGGRELQQFQQGSSVFAQSGCEGCHELDGQGNAGPGPHLDHVGSLLSKRQLARVLDDPQLPMPSFKNLPPAKFRALVEFLSLLRGR